MNYEKQIDTIITTAGKIKLGKVTVLTGKNGSGKSLLRKLLAASIFKKLEKAGKKSDIAHLVAAISMETRTQANYDFGAFASQGIDDPTNPTGSETINSIDAIFGSIKEDSPRFIVIDEPEIGMGEELIAALVIKLNAMFYPNAGSKNKKSRMALPKNAFGILVITHNRYIAENLGSEFLNLEGLSKEEWLTRIIVPTDIKVFQDDAIGLFRAINKRTEKNRKDKEKING